MYSSAAPDIASGRKTNRASNRRKKRSPDYGAGSNHSRSSGKREQQSAAAGVFALVARDRALLSPAQPCGGRDRLAPALLDRDRRRLRQLIPLGGKQQPALS